MTSEPPLPQQVLISRPTHQPNAAAVYGVAKVFAYGATINYRESYGLCASNGILFNQESARRGETLVTRKISRTGAAIKVGRQSHVFLGNLEAKRGGG